MGTKVRCAFVSLVFVLGCALCAYAQLRPEVTVKPKPRKPPAAKITPKPAEKVAPKPVPPQKAAEPEPAQIIIETSPNAEVYLDDQFAGRASSQGLLEIGHAKPGDHTLRVYLAGKVRYEKKVFVVPGVRARVLALDRIRVGGQVESARLIFRPQPEYPQLARTARIQGTVRMEVVIGKNGTVKELRVISGHPLLVKAALEAVQRWRYQPTLLDGEPLEVVTEADVMFNLAE